MKRQPKLNGIICGRVILNLSFVTEGAKVQNLSRKENQKMDILKVGHL